VYVLQPLVMTMTCQCLEFMLWALLKKIADDAVERLIAYADGDAGGCSIRWKRWRLRRSRHQAHR
jgi:hypothetical protein